MDPVRLRAWWAHRQGLDGSLEGADPAEVLEASGWARSVGGAGPYLTMHARSGAYRAEVDTAVAGLAIHELPSARGCTYVVPASHYAVALTMAQRRAPSADARLCDGIVDALRDEPLDPAAIKERLGTAQVLGDALSRLQADGRIRRVPINGRLDQQRYRYACWDGGPLATGAPSAEDAAIELVRCYLSWAGPATVEHIRWFTGFGVGATNAALGVLDVVPVEDDWLLLADDVEAFTDFEAPRHPEVSLLAGIDGVFLLRRNPADLIDPAAAGHPLLATGGRGLFDLPAHGIVDRGELVGLWEFDVDEGAIVWTTFRPPSEDVRTGVKSTEAFVRDDLGDARSFSLDSPESRRPRIEALRAFAA